MTNDRDLTTIIRSWLREAPSGPPDRDAVYARMLDRLPQTHQRRHWWLSRWFPFERGATRSADPGGLPSPWRFRSMFSATRVAAVVAVLALSGSMVIYSGAFDRATYQGAAPPASAEDMIAAVATFEHTTMPNVRDFGEATEEGGIGHLRGRVITSVHEDEHDPRLSGTAIFTVDAVDFGGRGPEWGTFRLENDEGAWQGTLTGYHAGNTTRLSGWLVGEGAYEGLSQYREMEHTGLGATMFRGIIVPGAPPIEARFPD